MVCARPRSFSSQNSNDVISLCLTWFNSPNTRVPFNDMYQPFQRNVYRNNYLRRTLELRKEIRDYRVVLSRRESAASKSVEKCLISPIRQLIIGGTYTGVTLQLIQTIAVPTEYLSRFKNICIHVITCAFIEEGRIKLCLEYKIRFDYYRSR